MVFRLASISFYAQDTALPFHRGFTRKRVKETIHLLLAQENKPIRQLVYVFCTDTYLLSLNQQYLQHDTLTDILTFDLSDKPGEIKGEVYISLDRVRENAQMFSVAVDEEILRVILHGALHLCGYGDHLPEEQKQMRALENRYLEYFFHPHLSGLNKTPSST
ncbi:MAG: rRNA maturation RNase YbeY [Thermoflavifilum sp.]|nr:rRNA maturation RNase YbeY [Thermoflavifilum sp.]